MVKPTKSIDTSPSLHDTNQWISHKRQIQSFNKTQNLTCLWWIVSVPTETQSLRTRTIQILHLITKCPVEIFPDTPIQSAPLSILYNQPVSHLHYRNWSCIHTWDTFRRILLSYRSKNHKTQWLRPLVWNDYSHTRAGEALRTDK